MRRSAVALALAYLFIVQGLLAPLASLRMDAAAVFGVVCVTNPDGTPRDADALGTQCDVSCLLGTQVASAPPAPVAPPPAPAAVFVRVAHIVGVESAVPVSHGPRPQSQRAPPLV